MNQDFRNKCLIAISIRFEDPQAEQNTWIPSTASTYLF